MHPYYEQMVATRRQLHQDPEEGWAEFTTTAFLVGKLRGLGYQVLLGKDVCQPEACLGRDPKVIQAGIEKARKNGVSAELLDEMQELTGCAAILDTGRPGPTLALRFDIDCVQVTESAEQSHLPAREGFTSLNPGLMHACGHDGHMSVGLAVCRWIAEHQDQLCGRVKILFQPAEEGVRGAAGMAASGIVDDADMFLSSHVAMIAKSGEVATDLHGFLCTTKWDITIHGKASHAGASPELGRNALAAAAHAAVQMLGISRHSGGMTRINIGQLIAGEGRNVIPAKGVLKLEVRGENSDINDFMSEQVKNICEGVSKSFGVSYEMRKMGEAVDLTADRELVDAINAAAREAGLKVIDKAMNFGGSEDATILARRVQARGGKAAFFVWGSDHPSGHHSALFDFREEDMNGAIELWSRLLPKLLRA